MADVSYTFTIFDDPDADIVNGELTQPVGINSAGEIVGNFGGSGDHHGFVYSHGIFTTIDVPGARDTLPYGINSLGQIVGIFSNSTGQRGFLYSDGIFTTIEIPGSGIPNGHAATRAFGINAAGEIVGDFDAVNPDNTIGTHGFLYSGGIFTVIDFPRSTSTQAFGINDVGQIVGLTGFPGVGGGTGFLYSRGTFSVINNPNAASTAGFPVTVAVGINNRGQIVGFFTDSGRYRPYVYEDGIFTTIFVPQVEDNLSFAYGINNSGHIVGYFNSAAVGAHGFLATPTHR